MFKKSAAGLLICILLLASVCPAFAATAVKASISANRDNVIDTLTVTRNNSFSLYFGVDETEQDGHTLNTYRFTVWYDPEYVAPSATPVTDLTDAEGESLLNGAETDTKTISGKQYNGYTYSFTSFEKGFQLLNRTFLSLASVKFSAKKVGSTDIYITNEDTLLLPVYTESAPQAFRTNIQNNAVTVTIETGSGGSGGGGGGGTPATPSAFTVTFMANGVASATMQVLANGYVTPPATPTLAGHTFDGWYTNETFSARFDFSAPIKANTTVYAKFSPVQAAENPFSDVTEADWFYDSVLYGVQNKLISGTSATAFSPYDTLTRGTMVTLLYRVEGEPEAPQNPFTDVESGMWYEKAIAWAADRGIVLGMGNNTFAPNDAITREQIAVILYKYAQSKGADMQFQADLTAFSDRAAVSDWAETALCWALDKGLIKGTSETTLSPSSNANRAEIATVLMRYLTQQN